MYTYMDLKRKSSISRTILLYKTKGLYFWHILNETQVFFTKLILVVDTNVISKI